MYPWTYVALHKATNEPVGMTELWLSKLVPYIADQDDTGVISEHRGHKLGTTLKYLMLQKLYTDERSKEVRWWYTVNAEVNEHMLNINDELGYKEFIQRYIYQFDRSELLENLKK